MDTQVEALQLIDQLYNDLQKDGQFVDSDITDVLRMSYKKISEKPNVVPIMNRLSNYVYYTDFIRKIHFSDKQNSYIRQIAALGKSAGLNGVYRANYGDKSQFFSLLSGPNGSLFICSLSHNLKI